MAIRRSLDNPVFFFLIVIIFVAFKFWLISEFAIYGETRAEHDDLHFIKQAESLMQGHWLGPYNQFTLIKGPAFSAWILLLHYLHIPLLAGHSLFYLLGCFGFAAFIQKATRNYIIASISFIILVLYLESIPRVIREGLYVPVTFSIFVLLALGYQQLAGRLWKLAAIAGLTGLLLSVFWMTREEGIWIVPSLLMCLVFFLYKLLTNKQLTRREHVIRALLLISPALILFASLTLIKQINKHYYQSYNVVEMNDPAFTGAYGSLLRVIPPQKIPYVPLTKATRQHIYTVSPTFRVLQRYLDESGWDLPGCRIYAVTCGEIAGGWFMWAFRDAVSFNGYYRDGHTAQQFYQNLKQEIDQACDKQALHCLPERDNLRPVIDERDVPGIWNSFKNGMYCIVSLYILSPQHLQENFFKASTGDQDYLNYFKQFIKGEFAPLNTGTLLSDYQQYKDNTLQYLFNGKISQFYVYCWPLVLCSALLMYGLNIFSSLRNKRLNFNDVFNSAILVAVVLRILILAIIDATSFPGITGYYISPAYPLVLAFIILSHINFFQSVFAKGKSQKNA